MQTNINNAEIAYVDINPCIRDEVPLVSYIDERKLYEVMSKCQIFIAVMLFTFSKANLETNLEEGKTADICLNNGFLDGK